MVRLQVKELPIVHRLFKAEEDGSSQGRRGTHCRQGGDYEQRLENLARRISARGRILDITEEAAVQPGAIVENFRRRRVEVSR